MARIDAAFIDFTQLDLLASQNTAIHRLDPRAKVLTTLVFIISVVSFGKYEVSALLPFFLFPAVMIPLGKLPAGFLVRKLLLVLPFVFFIGVFNPLFDRQALLTIGSVAVSGGWVSFASIILRSLLTVSVALIIVAVTGFNSICMALERLGMPRAFAVQLYFLYRYIFVLTDEGIRMARARELRTFGGKGTGLRSYGPLVGSLLLRTWERAERVHRAMLSRGFTGSFHVRREYRIGVSEMLFTVGWMSLFLLFRITNVPDLLGTLIMEAFR